MCDEIQQTLTQVKATVHKFKLPDLEDTGLITDTDPQKSLTLCPACKAPFTKPTALSCGYTLCFNCIPKSSSFQCPSFTCLRTHSNINKTTVLLEEIQSSMLSNNNMQSIKTLLKCPICFMTLDNPITTSCGHSFCKSCLDTIYNDFDCKKCPICRSELSNVSRCNQLLHRWVSLFSASQDTSGKKPNKYIPVIEVKDTIISPSQSCLVHISKDYSLFKEMSESPNQAYHAICLSKNKDNQRHCIGTMLQISNIECMPDLRKCVILVKGLYHVQLNNMWTENNEFTGDILAFDHKTLDPFYVSLPKSKRWALPIVNNDESGESCSSETVTLRKRRCSSLMRSPSSSPNKPTYRKEYAISGAYKRLTWSDLMFKQFHRHS